LPILRVAVTHVPSVIDSAAPRFSDPHGQQVLSDFTDGSGLTLLEGLASRRLSPLMVERGLRAHPVLAAPRRLGPSHPSWTV